MNKVEKYDYNEYPKTKIIGIGKMGKNIIDEILVDIKSLEYLIIDDSETVSVDKENEIADFLSSADVVIVTGMVTETSNVMHLLSWIDFNITKDTLSIVLLGINSSDQKSLLSIMANTIFLNNYSTIIIYRTLINSLISNCFPSWVSRYGALISVNPIDVKTILAYGNTHYIGIGSGIGIDRARDSVLMAINNLSSNIEISKIKSMLFLFNSSTNVNLFELEEAIEMFKEKYDYTNDILFMCVIDEQVPKDESEVIMITSS